MGERVVHRRVERAHVAHGAAEQDPALQRREQRGRERPGRCRSAARRPALTLRDLERDGLLVHPTVPPQVEYEAAEIARDLLASTRQLSGWAERHRAAMAAARAAYHARNGAGQDPAPTIGPDISRARPAM